MMIFDHVDPADAEQNAEEMRRQVEAKKKADHEAQLKEAAKAADKMRESNNATLVDKPWVEADDIANAFGLKDKDKDK